jgi:hypothetical protein
MMLVKDAVTVEAVAERRPIAAYNVLASSPATL